ncbi:MAG: uroporphyrinogen decarboxylase family protein [Candidatus Merdivicinus sp.]|jgi:uroporphyrinogen decarboxylase
MTSRERIRNIIEHRPADQVGVSFNDPHPSDIIWAHGCALKKPAGIDDRYFEWGEFPELLAQVGDFNGEVRYDYFGNILGRLNGITKGECVKGALTDWEMLEQFELPEIDTSIYTPEQAAKNRESDKYLVVGSPFAVFSVLRDTRLMTNALMDTVLEPDYVEQFLQKILARNLELIEHLKDFGVDALMIGDDWGTQDRTFISPSSFRQLFKPIYTKLAEKLHSYNMHLLVHSCGYNYAFMQDFLEAGIDVLQFDQLGAYGYERMADEFAGKVTFWSPLDIQMTLPTGDRELIEREAFRMISAFRGKGSLILKDYPTYQDIEVDEEWATWARNVFLAHLAD